MPRKYRPTKDDYLIGSSVLSIYGMLRPIEEQLQRGGYRGTLLSDYGSGISNELERNVNHNLAHDELMMQVPVKDEGEIVTDYNFLHVATLTKSSAKDFRDYVNKFSDYLELLIKNTPPEEYPEELAEMKFHQAYIRMLKVFGSRELWMDQLGFFMNGRNFDGDMTSIREVGNKKEKYVSRELWRHMRKYYPYSDVRDVYTEVTNLVCDREESEEKDSYTEEIEYREKYKKALQKYVAANNALAAGPQEKERIAKLYIRDDIIKKMKQQDGPEKDVDYYGILKRVEEQEKKNEVPDPEEKAIADSIKNKVNNKYNNPNPGQIDKYNSRYENELVAAGCVDLNEMDFSGSRAAGETAFAEVEAQINAIDMGWPIDELIHVQRLQMIIRPAMNISGCPDREGFNNFKDRCIAFYNERIKDKKYPATEAARQAFYRDFYALAQESEIRIRGEFPKNNNQEETFEGMWLKFRKDIKKTMEKSLSSAQKVVIQHVQDDEITVLSEERMNALRDMINTRKKTGHIDSSEFSELKRSFTEFAEAYQADADAFKIDKDHGLSPENLELLKKVRDAARVYLKERDKEGKNLDDRSAMGKARYEGVAKTFTLVNHLILKHEKRLEDQAKVKKEAACAKGRKETREAFFKAGSKEEADYIKFAKRRAGGEEAYRTQLAAEKKAEEDEAAKEPETEDEKYEKLINACRLKKDAPVVTEGAELSSRIENLSTMLAAQELKKTGRPFDMAVIADRAKMIRTVYHMDEGFRVVSQDPNGPNGPKALRNSLAFPFRAEEAKRKMEEHLYAVQKCKYRNTFEAQNKYQADLAEVLSRKRTVELSDQMKDLVEAINEIMRINLKDNTMVGMNAYKLRKANVRIMKAVINAFEGPEIFDKDGFAPKLALDTLAVLTTYTGCEKVTRKFLNKLNNTKKTPDGQKQNINVENFTGNFGVKHSKNLTVQVRNNANQANRPANPVL